MRKSLLTATAGLAALALTSPGPIAAQGEADQQLGNVHFETSCNEVAQRRFDRAMRYQHSFWYSAARDIFQEAAKADAECGMAYWGVALSLPQQSARPDPGAESPARSRRDPEGQGDRRQDRARARLHRCARLMYADYDKLTHVQRIGSYLEAMEKLAAKYPNDDEAQIAYAITLNTSASPADKTYAQQLKGAAILEPIWKRQPQHPGVAHYLIHLYDYPAIADKGLDAASATPRSRRPRRMRSTCRRTSSPASATGRSRSRPTSPR